jgi:hypothetical protein
MVMLLLLADVFVDYFTYSEFDSCASDPVAGSQPGNVRVAGSDHFLRELHA